MRIPYKTDSHFLRGNRRPFRAIVIETTGTVITLANGLGTLTIDPEHVEKPWEAGTFLMVDPITQTIVSAQRQDTNDPNVLISVDVQDRPLMVPSAQFENMRIQAPDIPKSVVCVVFLKRDMLFTLRNGHGVYVPMSEPTQVPWPHVVPNYVQTYFGKSALLSIMAHSRFQCHPGYRKTHDYDVVVLQVPDDLQTGASTIPIISEQWENWKSLREETQEDPVMSYILATVGLHFR